MIDKVAIRFRDQWGFTSTCVVITTTDSASAVESAITYAQDACEWDLPCNSAILDFWVWYKNRDDNEYVPRDFFVLPYEVTDNETFDVYTIDILTGKIVEMIKSA